MDKSALGKKLREIEKALCLEVEPKYFEPLHKDITDWISWNRLHTAAAAQWCDTTYVLLIDECCRKVTRGFLGDTC